MLCLGSYYLYPSAEGFVENVLGAKSAAVNCSADHLCWAPFYLSRRREEPIADMPQATLQQGVHWVFLISNVLL